MKKPAYPPLNLDVMLNGRFVCQLRYKGYPFPKIIDGKVKLCYEYSDLRRFVYEQRPSLIGKNVNIIPSKQTVFN